MSDEFPEVLEEAIAFATSHFRSSSKVGDPDSWRNERLFDLAGLSPSDDSEDCAEFIRELSSTIWSAHVTFFWSGGLTPFRSRQEKDELQKLQNELLDLSGSLDSFSRARQSAIEQYATSCGHFGCAWEKITGKKIKDLKEPKDDLLTLLEALVADVNFLIQELPPASPRTPRSNACRYYAQQIAEVYNEHARLKEKKGRFVRAVLIDLELLDGKPALRTVRDWIQDPPLDSSDVTDPREVLFALAQESGALAEDSPDDSS